MELTKKIVAMNQVKQRVVTQITVDDDMNVPDTKPDIETIVQGKGQCMADNCKALEGQAQLKGELQFQVLYITDTKERPLHSLSGKIPIDEMIHMEQAKNNALLKAQIEIEDLTISIINSRKISVQAILNIHIDMETMTEEEIAVDAPADDQMECCRKKMEVLQLLTNKKDIFRIKEEVPVPPHQSNIYEILWENVGVTVTDIKLTQDKINVLGDLQVFLLYQGEGDERKVQWLNETYPFHGVVDCQGCHELLVPDIGVAVKTKELEIRADSDGEERIVGIDMTIELDIKLYEEEEVEYLSDIYGTKMLVEPEWKESIFQHLLMQNQSKYRVNDRVKIKNEMPGILQICNASGAVKLDEVQLVEDGIQVDGVVLAEILYVTTEDKRPFHMLQTAIPFSYQIEAKGIHEGCIYKLLPACEQLSVSMIDSEELDVKAVVAIQVFVVEQEQTKVMRGISQSEIPYETIEKMPGMIGYIAGEGDTLWSVGKQYFLPVKDIKEWNHLTSDTLQKGDKLLLLKNVKTIHA